MAFYRQHPECIVARREELTLSLRGQEQLALAIAAWVAKCFYSGTPPPDLDDLVQRYNTPTTIVAATLEVLEKGGFIRRLDGLREAYAPARLATQVLDAARAAGHVRISLTASLEGQSAVAQVAAAEEAAGAQALAGVSLKDLTADKHG